MLKDNEAQKPISSAPSEASSSESRPNSIPGTMYGMNTGLVALPSSTPTGSNGPSDSAVPLPSNGFENPNAGRSATDTTSWLSDAV